MCEDGFSPQRNRKQDVDSLPERKAARYVESVKDFNALQRSRQVIIRPRVISSRPTPPPTYNSAGQGRDPVGFQVGILAYSAHLFV